MPIWDVIFMLHPAIPRKPASIYFNRMDDWPFTRSEGCRNRTMCSLRWEAEVQAGGEVTNYRCISEVSAPNCFGKKIFKIDAIWPCSYCDLDVPVYNVPQKQGRKHFNWGKKKKMWLSFSTRPRHKLMWDSHPSSGLNRMCPIKQSIH